MGGPFAGLTRACLALAWHNLWEHRARTLLALAGIVFALFLALMQLGLLQAVRKEATLLYEFFDFDLALLSREYQILYAPASFDSARLLQARAVDGVAAVAELNIDRSHWTDLASGQRSSLLLFGFDGASAFIADPDLRQGLAALQARNRRAVLVDAYAHADYGRLDVGTRGEIAGHEVEVAGQFRLGLFFYAEGSALTNSSHFRELTGSSRRAVSLGLVRLAPGGDRAALQRALREQLPPDVVVVDRETLIQRERDYFTRVKPTGLMFYSGALIAVLVSAAIFMQVLSTDLIRRLPSYATLRAMGFGAGFVHAVALLQSLLLGLLGFGPALLLALGANRLVAALTHLPAALTPATLALLAGLFTLSAALSLASALRRLRRVDPAELFA